jgi:hypothetical protein
VQGPPSQLIGQSWGHSEQLSIGLLQMPFPHRLQRDAQSLAQTLQLSAGVSQTPFPQVEQAPQSPGHVRHVSPGSQVWLPQTMGQQSCGQVPQFSGTWQLLSPQVGGPKPSLFRASDGPMSGRSATRASGVPGRASGLVTTGASGVPNGTSTTRASAAPIDPSFWHAGAWA